MRKYQRNEILETISTFSEDHDDIKRFVESGDCDVAKTILSSCQEKAIELGNEIEALEGEGFVTVKCLEEYCETVFLIFNELESSGSVNPNNIHKKLNKSILNVESSARNDIVAPKEAVFLPYKASMWDSLESVWKKFDADEEWDALVIPIPYYDRNPDGSYKEMHYEGDLFPKDVPVIHYNSYDFEKNHPEEIYICNPYDGLNLVTCVHPFFFSKNIHKFTDKLIYIPYFVLAEPDLKDEKSIKKIESFALTPGVVEADKVIVQSEKMRQAYIKILAQKFGEKTKKTWEQRISGEGSPKFEKLLNTKREDLEIPKEWAELIKKEDGSEKKIIIFNTSLGAMLRETDKMLEKIERTLKIFYEFRDEVVLWWRPHPLIVATLSSMRPEALEKYNGVREKYVKEGWGIFDDTPDLDRALVYSDAYYGDDSSLLELYKKTGKPMMIQDFNC